MNLFSYDGPISRFLYLVADIVVLHLLWLLCSLPLFTMGAANTALYYSCMKRIRTGEGHVWQNFLQSFRANFRQATLLWLLLLAAGAVLFTDLRIGMAVGGGLGRAMLLSCSVFLIPYILVLLYIFPVQAKFENTLFDNFKNALLMSLQSFGYSLVLLLVAGTFVALGLFFRPFIGLLICCGAGLYGYLTSSVFVQIFRRYLPDEYEEDYEKSDLSHER
ncbi:MAG: DUF624 domain-containing protein [Oscillospiraceae bacterium]|nr:DUF624 domain-containing protein [Oscillospiraceae bacterium]